MSATSATMIESVQARQRGAFEFEEHYDNLCALQNSCPIPAVKAHLQSRVLDLNADRIRANDWSPILNTLRINKTLEFIGVRSFFQQPVDDGKQEKKQPPQWRRKTPAIRSKEITYRLCKALRECVTNSTSVVCLELQGLPLRERDMQILSKGIAKNHSLRHLSVEFCTIGDDGVEILCKGIKNSPTLTSLNFSGCGLTFQGADMLAKIIKHQSMKRHNEAWRDSLRYRRPDLDGMMGIRRITVNKNPLMGDQGALAFAEALKDDLWLKALDMQQCGISDIGAKALLQVLKFNTTMVVLDLRLNPLVDRDIQQSLMEQVLINSDGQDTEYKWIRAESPHDTQRNRSPRRRRTKTSGSFRGRAGVKIIPGSGHKRSKSAGASAYGKPFDVPEVTRPGPGFVPWRTAMRAMSYRGYPSAISGWEKGNGSSPMESPAVIINKGGSDDEDCKESYMRAHEIDDGSFDDSADLKDAKEMKIVLAQMKRRLEEEREARNQADKKMLELTIENTRLRQEVNMLRQTGGHSLLEDDKVLDSIEASFKKFHSFLDLLRDAGLGQLITIAGLDQAPMSMPTTSHQSPYRTAFPVTSMAGLPHHNIDVRDPQYYDEDPVEDAGKPNQSLYGIPEASPPSRDHARPADDAILTGSIRPHLIPDNYTTGQILDPTLHQMPEEDEYAFKPSTADELYQKLRRQAEAALERSRSYYETEPQVVVTSTPHKTKSPVNVPETPEPQDRGDAEAQDEKTSPKETKRVSPKPAERKRLKSPVDAVSSEVLEVPETEGVSEGYSDTFEHSDRQELIKSMEDITEHSPSPPAVVPESDEDDF